MSIMFVRLFIITVAFLTLCALGTWQLQRLEWKENIIAQLDSEYAQNSDQSLLHFEDLSTAKLRYGNVRGRFDYTKEILVGPVSHDGKIGYRVVTPIKLQTGGSLLVQRGWIDQNSQDRLKATHPKGNITVTGIFRQPDWNRFTPDNSPENNIWTKLDIKEIAEAKNINPIAPVILYAQKASKDFQGLIMQQQKWYPRNKHKQYALFWFTMAFVLLGICGFYARQHQKS